MLFLDCLGMRLTEAQIVVLIVTHTYSILIFYVDLGSFLNKAFHCVVMAFFSCNVHGSPLIDRMK